MPARSLKRTRNPETPCGHLADPPATPSTWRAPCKHRLGNVRTREATRGTVKSPHNYICKFHTERAGTQTWGWKQRQTPEGRTARSVRSHHTQTGGHARRRSHTHAQAHTRSHRHAGSCTHIRTRTQNTQRRPQTHTHLNKTEVVLGIHFEIFYFLLVTETDAQTGAGGTSVPGSRCPVDGQPPQHLTADAQGRQLGACFESLILCHKPFANIFSNVLCVLKTLHSNCTNNKHILYTVTSRSLQTC